MKKPNFFIIGAPKCGTTSWASWLARHPQVYMSPIKEPHHFSTDIGVMTPRRTDYEKLFRGANDQHRAIGEASPGYLFSNVAVSEIEKYANQPKYIVCLRNPVEMAYSLHEQAVVVGYETIRDFERAWSLSEERLRGKRVPFWCQQPTRLAYSSRCKLGEQLQRLYSIVPRERVHTILLDDVKSDARGEYLKVLAFLGLDDDGRQEFPVKNPAKEVRSKTINYTVNILSWMKRRLFNYEFGLDLLSTIAKNNVRYRSRPPMNPEMRRKLEDFFSEDITLLGKLLERDLDSWLE